MTAFGNGITVGRNIIGGVVTDGVVVGNVGRVVINGRVVSGAGAGGVGSALKEAASSFDIAEPIRRLALDADAGGVRIIAGEPGSAVHVDQVLRSANETATASHSVNDGVLNIVGRSGAPNDTTDFVIKLAPESMAQAKLAAGSLDVEGLKGGLTAKTQAADINARDVAGDLSLSSQSGDIVGEGLKSDHVMASTMSGDVELDMASSVRSLQARSMSGDVRVNVPEGRSYDVDMSSMSGRTRSSIDSGGNPEGSISASSMSGDVRVGHGGGRSVSTGRENIGIEVGRVRAGDHVTVNQRFGNVGPGQSVVGVSIGTIG